MKNAYIFHGTDCKPEDFWYPWLKTQLEMQGYFVTVPYFPDINHEPIDTFLNKVTAAHMNSFNDRTVLIGHSAGCPLILSLLEQIDFPVKKVVLVAGYANRFEGKADPVLQDSYDWERIRENAEDFVLFNSDNDPWGCDDKAGRYIVEHLNKGRLIVMKGEGHMGSTKYNQPYKEFPQLLEIIINGR